MSSNGGRRRKASARPQGRDGAGAGGRSAPARAPWWQFRRSPGKCPKEGLLDDFFAQKLTPESKQRVADHIANCDLCSADFDDTIAALIELFERNAGDEEADGVPAPSKSFEWIDSTRLRTLALGGDSEESPLPEEMSVLAEAVAAVEASKRLPRPRPWPLRPTFAVVGFAVILAASLSSHLPTARREVTPTAVARAERLVAPRFTGRLPWAPVVTAWPRHVLHEPYLAPGAARYVAAAQQRRTVVDELTPAELGATGAIYALGGRADSAVEALRRAAAASPGSAELLSDLGAALLAREEIGERRRLQEPDAELEDYDADIPAALEAIDRALEIAPGLPEGLFNRALALERLYLRRSAVAAWRAYLEVDDSSAWAREARERMEAIVIPARPDPLRIRAEIAAAADAGDSQRLAQLVASYRHLARASVQDDLLPRWGEAWLAGDRAEAEHQLAAAGLVADEWEAQTTDATLLEAVAGIETAAGVDRVRLAEGYRDLGRASRALADFDLDNAQSAAERSLHSLPVRSPGATWAALVRLACLGYRGGEVVAQTSVIALSSPNDPASVGRAYWISGVVHARRGDLTTALAEYRQALTAYERLGDVESTVALHHLIGDVYGLMGAIGACWKHRRLALEQAATLSDRDRALDIVRLSAILALHQGDPRVANEFLAAALAESDVDEPGEIALTYIWRGRVLLELGRRHQALQGLRRAGAWMSRAKPFERRNLGPDLDFAYGLASLDPEYAVQRLSRAFDEFESMGSHVRLPGVLLARARAHLQAGRTSAADADLRHGLALIDEQAGGERGPLSTFRFDRPADFFSERVRLALLEGRQDEAFAAAEAARAHRLQTLTGEGEAGAEALTRTLLRPAEIAAQLDADTTLLHYSWLPDGVRVWRIDRNGVSLRRAVLPPRQLVLLISAFAADLEAGAWTAATRATAMQLHAALLGPVRPATSRLVIVPDNYLHTLPFAALVDPASHRFLLEDLELTIAPSAAAFLRSRARRVLQPATPQDALVVGDPLLDPTLFPGIRSLPGARSEAREVAMLYPRRELLLGSGATRTAFLRALGHRDVVHFSGHALANRVDPDRSSLPLAEEQRNSGLLVASDIARLDLTGTHAVVLSGCETGVGGGGSESPLSLAHAFLAAGVPDVVASLWPIADVPSAPFMTAFHRRLRNGETPASALRSAQLSMLRSSDSAQRSPSAWAAFEAFGG